MPRGRWPVSRAWRSRRAKDLVHILLELFECWQLLFAANRSDGFEMLEMSAFDAHLQFGQLSKEPRLLVGVSLSNEPEQLLFEVSLLFLESGNDGSVFPYCGLVSLDLIIVESQSLGYHLLDRLVRSTLLGHE